MISWPGNASLISLKIGSTSAPPYAPTVVSTAGTPSSFAARASAAVLLMRRLWSMECTFTATAGWWSMSTSTEFSVVSSFGLSVMTLSSPSGRRRPDLGR